MTNLPAIRAIIFDLGGVLMRTDDPTLRVELADELGVTRHALEGLVFSSPVAQRAEIGQATPTDVWAEAARQLNLPSERIPELSRRFFAGDRVDFELIGLIARLRGRYSTALLSNSWHRDLARVVREDLHIPDTFDVIISSAALGTVKPGPAIYQQAVAQIGVPAEAAVFVDDNDDNIAGAAAVGLRTIRFFNAKQTSADLLAMVGEARPKDVR